MNKTRWSKGGRRLLVLLGTLLCAALAVVGIYARRDKAPELPPIPTVNLDGADPAVVKAVRFAREALEKTPQTATAWGQYAFVLDANGFSDAAHICYHAAASLDPRNPKWPYLQGYLYHHGPGGPEAALPYFELAASLSPPNSMAQVLRADMLLELGRLDEAAEEYRQVLAADKDNAFARLGLGKLALARQEYQDSLQYLAPIAENPLVQKQACAIRARVYDRLGNPAEAEGERRRLAELPEDRLRPDDDVIQVLQSQVGIHVYLQKVHELWEQQRLVEMRDVLQEAVHRYPDSVEAWASLGNVYGTMGDLVSAERAVRKTVELAPTSVERRLSLANVQIRQRRYHEATETLQKAIELNPKDGRAYFSLGECRQGLGDAAGAAEAYRQVLLRSPDHPLARQRLEELNESP